MVNAQKRILIAEDEIPMAKALVLKLTKSGFVAEAVHNGEDALSSLRKGGYDAILLDLVMPKLDGFGVLAALEKEKIEIPTIILSNLGQEEDLERTKKYGIKDYFVKSDTPIVEVVDYVNKAIVKQ